MNDLTPEQQRRIEAAVRKFKGDMQKLVNRRGPYGIDKISIRVGDALGYLLIGICLGLLVALLAFLSGGGEDRMNFDEYQQRAMRTASGSLAGRNKGIVTAALGLTGEAGEFADHVKKWYAQDHDLDMSLLVMEAGDILWYLARFAEASGVPLSVIAESNIAKLKARYPDGFRADLSRSR